MTLLMIPWMPARLFFFILLYVHVFRERTSRARVAFNNVFSMAPQVSANERGLTVHH